MAIQIVHKLNITVTSDHANRIIILKISHLSDISQRAVI